MFGTLKCMTTTYTAAILAGDRRKIYPSYCWFLISKSLISAKGFTVFLVEEPSFGCNMRMGSRLGLFALGGQGALVREKCCE